jgi:uncharacterized membrane protein (UPF0136 family)
MNVQASIVFIYALIVFVGGLMGYIKAQSLISLIMGTGFAIALFICGGALWKNLSWGYYGSLVLSLILLVFFGYRYSLTMAIFPAAVMTVLSAIVLILLNFLPKR